MERELEKSVHQKFRNALKGPNFRFARDEKWETNLLLRRFDIVIYYKHNPFVVIEVKSRLGNKNRLAIGTDQVRSALSITNARYGIVTDSEDFYFFDKSTEDEFEIKEFEFIIDRLSDQRPIKFGDAEKKEVQNIFIHSLENHLQGNDNLKELLPSNDFVSKLDFDIDSNTIHLNDKSDSHIEDKLFGFLVGELIENEICRYGTFDTVFAMLNYLSVRLNGIAGMNDKTEINYVDSYLDKVEKPLSAMHHNSVSAMNKRYITSCSRITNKDDLTLWRLYGDDAKGVCLIYQVEKTKLKNNILVRPVKYANKQGVHAELEFLKQVINAVEKRFGVKFDFRKLGIWKHFFKPYEYFIEEEVRLLVVDKGGLKTKNKGWVKTYSHSILNPFVDFELNTIEFPIQLKEIILGPKFPEQELNKLQLEELVRRKKKLISDESLSTKLNNLKVRFSKINHYR